MRQLHPTSRTPPFPPENAPSPSPPPPATGVPCATCRRHRHARHVTCPRSVTSRVSVRRDRYQRRCELSVEGSPGRRGGGVGSLPAGAAPLIRVTTHTDHRRRLDRADGQGPEDWQLDDQQAWRHSLASTATCRLCTLITPPLSQRVSALSLSLPPSLSLSLSLPVFGLTTH